MRSSDFSTTQRVSRALKHLESSHGWVVGPLVRTGLRDKLKEMWLSWLGRKKAVLTAVRTSVAAEIQRLVGPEWRVLKKHIWKIAQASAYELVNAPKTLTVKQKNVAWFRQQNLISKRKRGRKAVDQMWDPALLGESSESSSDSDDDGESS